MEDPTFSSQGPSALARRIIMSIAVVVTILGILMLISGLVNLIQTPAIRAAARHTADFPGPLNPLSSLPPSIAIALTFVVTQNWLTMVLVQFGFAAIALTTGVGLCRRHSWSRVSLEGLSWVGAILLAIPVAWVARWMIATPTEPLLGFRGGLQTLPSGVGQPVATLIQLFVAAPLPLLAWTPTGVFIGTVASVAVPIACVILIVFLRRSREAVYHGHGDHDAGAHRSGSRVISD